MQCFSSIPKSVDDKNTITLATKPSPFFSRTFIQPKLTINQPNDVYEQEADAMADKVMHMTDKKNISQPFFGPSISPVQRNCEHCEEEEKKLQRKEINGTQHTSHNEFENYAGNLNSGGEALSREQRDFFEPRLGYDFSRVKIHNNSTAARSAASINALAYTSGNNIVFNNGQYSPTTDNGKRLLAHELTHVVQQQANRIQRAVHKGQDHGGKYEFDDRACTLSYSQDWYVKFPSSMAAASQTTYLANAEGQVETVWSHKHRLVPVSGGCACNHPGIDVNVNLNTFNESRRGRHGYDVTVTTDPTTGLTTQPLRNLELSDTHDVPVNTGSGLTQQRVAHEFGHTLGITDEYHWWARLWNASGHNDPESIMHFGDEVRPRHYQHFADLVNNEVEDCRYRPAGTTSLTLSNPLRRLGVTGALSLDNADFILDLQLDRRLGNTDLLGLFTPRLGFRGLLNTANGNVMAGPTVSFSLNRIAHPIYVDIGTGIFFDPEDPGRAASLNIPASATVGFRGNGFSAGINYTGLIDVLGSNGYTQMIGLNLQFDLARRK